MNIIEEIIRQQRQLLANIDRYVSGVTDAAFAEIPDDRPPTPPPINGARPVLREKDARVLDALKAQLLAGAPVDTFKLAAAADVNGPSIYYHIGNLEKAGYIRRTGGRRELKFDIIV